MLNLKDLWQLAANRYAQPQYLTYDDSQSFMLIAVFKKHRCGRGTGIPWAPCLLASVDRKEDDPITVPGPLSGHSVFIRQFQR